MLLLLRQLLLGGEVVVLEPVKFPPQYLIQKYLLLVGGLHVMSEVDLATAVGGHVREHPLLPQGVISRATSSSSLSEQGTIHLIENRALAN